MKHYLYCSSGNTEGLDEYVAFFEIADDGYCARYLEIRPAGDALKYTEDKPADEFGSLPEGPWDKVEAAKPKYGTPTLFFNGAWNSIHCQEGDVGRFWP